MKTLEMNGRANARRAAWITLTAAALLVGGLVAFSTRDNPVAAPEHSDPLTAVSVAAMPTVPAPHGSASDREHLLSQLDDAPPAELPPKDIGDGKSLEVIRQWAHNDLEIARMLEENDRIYRRQRVMLKETVVAMIEQTRLAGETLRELTLPGLDGEEILIEVKNAEISPSGLRGVLYGQVAGKPDSMAVVSFLRMRQAYTILSPSDDLYLDAEPHSDGDVIVKSINVDKYGAGLCGVQ